MVCIGKICIFITEQSKKGKSKNQVLVGYKIMLIVIYCNISQHLLPSKL